MTQVEGLGNLVVALARGHSIQHLPFPARQRRERRQHAKVAADVLYLLLGPDLYWTMVLGRDWTEQQLAGWTERVILDDLFR